MAEQPPPFTAEMMTAEAGNACGAWVQGYTEPDPAGEHPQRRVKLMRGSDEEHGQLIFKVEGAVHTDERNRFFRVRVTSEEIPDPDGPEASDAEA